MPPKKRPRRQQQKLNYPLPESFETHSSRIESQSGTWDGSERKFSGRCSCSLMWFIEHDEKCSGPQGAKGGVLINLINIKLLNSTFIGKNRLRQAILFQGKYVFCFMKDKIKAFAKASAKIALGFILIYLDSFDIFAGTILGSNDCPWMWAENKLGGFFPLRHTCQQAWNFLITGAWLRF